MATSTFTCVICGSDASSTKKMLRPDKDFTKEEIHLCQEHVDSKIIAGIENLMTNMYMDGCRDARGFGQWCKAAHVKYVAEYKKYGDAFDKMGIPHPDKFAYVQKFGRQSGFGGYFQAMGNLAADGKL